METHQDEIALEQGKLSQLFPIHSIWSRRGLDVYENTFGKIAYKSTRYGLLFAGDPIVESKEDLTRFYQALQNDFKNKPIAGYYFSNQIQNHDNWSSIRAGTSEMVKLNSPEFQSQLHPDVDRARKKRTSLNCQFLKVSPSEFKHYLPKIKQVHKKWLRSKPGKPIGFLLGPPQLKPEDELFLAVDKEGEIQGFLIFCPYLQNKKYYLDQMVRDPTANKFLMENLTLDALTELQKQGVEEVSLGFSPFVLPEKKGLVGNLFWLKSKTNWIYSNKGLKHFKSKFSTHSEKRYVAYAANTSPMRALWIYIAGTYFK